MSALEAVADPAPRTRRGTSNGNQRGNAEDRRRRCEWLVETYRADRDVPDFHGLQIAIDGVPLGMGESACRCYRCGTLLTVDTVTVDRIVPGCKGGSYRRDNIRPACGSCNSETGGPLANGKAHQAAKKAARRRGAVKR